jgi:hypothetical protein
MRPSVDPSRPFLTIDLLQARTHARSMRGTLWIASSAETATATDGGSRYTRCLSFCVPRQNQQSADRVFPAAPVMLESRAPVPDCAAGQKLSVFLSWNWADVTPLRWQITRVQYVCEVFFVTRQDGAARVSPYGWLAKASQYQCRVAGSKCQSRLPSCAR